ncbi:MAG TPA: DUF6305 family protein [Vicinamibacterales bacterium]|nr:DUF6305 family protein [Vicinamibacterales bacterium]
MSRPVRALLPALLGFAVLLAGPAPALAQKGETPVLVTSCGQSPGPLRLTVFMKRLQIDHILKEDASVKDLGAKPYKTLVVVTGSSLKGMGAAGVSIDDEIKRITALINEAKKKGITVVGAHVEGMERRAKNAAPGDNSDEMSIDAVAPKANFLIVRKDGDEDGRFTTLSKTHGIPVVFFEKNTEIQTVLKSVFGK